MATKSRKSGGRDDWQPPLRDTDGKISVLVEVAAAPGVSAMAAASTVRGVEVSGFDHDEEFAPVPLRPGAEAGMAAAAPTTYVMRGRVNEESDFDALRQQADVLGVWRDTPIAPFPAKARMSEVEPTESLGTAACPIPPCDCSPGTPKGTMADVANYLGVSQVWSLGFRGAGIVVGVVDSGITAQGRPVKAGQTSRRIPRVIGGWPTADWGTETQWGEHGNMTSTDVLGMAPDSQVYDLRISGASNIPSTISRALQAFQWAIDRHRVDGTPHVLTNSWGIFQESWDPSYARDPNHPFTRKVVEALGEGILVLFAAGNCGGTCPDGRCGSDNGPGRSIWGANSLPQVMTVGAVNKDEQFVGYSSQGPGALDPNKPDFCGVTHFTGYFTSDSGTSAATPIVAGAVALLKQAFPAKTQAQIKDALKATAKDIGPTGFDQHSGAGIIRIKSAYDRLAGPVILPSLACPSSPIRCQQSLMIPCESRQIICQRSVATPCVSTQIRCGPSVLTPCVSTQIRCGPSVLTPCVTSQFTCNSVACPSRVGCPSDFCKPIGPEGAVDWEGGAEAWYGDPGTGAGEDPTSGWYGY